MNGVSDPFEVPYRVEGGVWSDQALATPHLDADAVNTEMIGRISAAFAPAVEVLNQWVEAWGDVAVAISDSLYRVIYPGYPYRPGDSVPASCRIVKPAKGGKVWLAWQTDIWVPIHRERGRGWVWRE